MATPENALQCLRIPQLAAASHPLSSAQQEFNRLTARVGQLEADGQALREAATALRQRVQQEYRPLQARHNEQRAALVRVLDQAYTGQQLSRAERAKLAALIAQAGHDLPAKGFPELQALVAKYGPPPLSATQQAVADQAAADALKQDYARRYGLEFDFAADLRTPAQVRAYVAQLAAEAEAARAQQREARRTRRKQSPKRQAAAAREQGEAVNTTKAVRGLYLDLVKHLHPDREPDEAEKARKTALLQQVTAAYEANELLTLLRLQLELNRIDQEHLATLADEQLHYYNTLLRAQARELEHTLRTEQQRLASFAGKASPAAGAEALTRDFERQKQQLTAKVAQLSAQVAALAHDPAALKSWLGHQQLPAKPLG